MKIKILSDSTCDLSKALLEENDITLVPLTVIKNDEQFKDGVSITPDVIFQHVANGGSLCTTSANSLGEYADWFEKYAGEYDGVIHINIGSGSDVLTQLTSILPASPAAIRMLAWPLKIIPMSVSSTP